MVTSVICVVPDARETEAGEIERLELVWATYWELASWKIKKDKYINKAFQKICSIMVIAIYTTLISWEQIENTHGNSKQR